MFRNLSSLIAQLAVLGLLTACVDEPYRPVAVPSADVILVDIGLADTTDELEVARSALEFVYSVNQPLGAYSQLSAVQGLDDRFGLAGAYEEFKAGRQRYLCEGMAVTMYYMLSELGLGVRLTGLATEGYLAGTNPYDGHASTEVLVNDRWVIADPTFNVMVTCDSQLVSYLEARACSQPLEFVYGATQLEPGRTVDGYYLPYSSLLHAISYWKTANAAHDNSGEVPYPGWLAARCGYCVQANPEWHK
jgi:hypothetical protein